MYGGPTLQSMESRKRDQKNQYECIIVYIKLSCCIKNEQDYNREMLNFFRKKNFFGNKNSLFFFTQREKDKICRVLQIGKSGP